MPTKIELKPTGNCALCGKGHIDGQKLIPVGGLVKSGQNQMVPLKDEKSIHVHFPKCTDELGAKTRASLNRKPKTAVCGVCRQRKTKNDMRIGLNEMLTCPECRTKQLRAIGETSDGGDLNSQAAHSDTEPIGQSAAGRENI